MGSQKRQKDTTQRGAPEVTRCPVSTGEEWRNDSRKKEETEPKQKQHPAVDVTGDGSKVRCCKEQYCTSMRYHYMPVRMAAIQKSTSNKCWRGCG